MLGILQKITMKKEIATKDNVVPSNAASMIAIAISYLVVTVFKVHNQIVLLCTIASLFIIQNIYNYKRLKNFQANKNLQFTNRRMALLLLFMNVIYIICFIGILIQIFSG